MSFEFQDIILARYFELQLSEIQIDQNLTSDAIQEIWQVSS